VAGPRVCSTEMATGRRAKLVVGALSAALTLLLALPGAAAGVAWHADFDAATAAAQESGRPILAFFHSTGCGPCAQMEQETLTDPRVTSVVAANFEAVNIDALAQIDLATRYLVAFYPTVKFVDADGASVYDSRGFVPVDQFIAVMEDALAAHQALTRAREAAARPDVTAEGALAIARDFLQAAQYEDAAGWARTALAGGADAAEAQFVLGVALVDFEEPAGAEGPLLAALTAANGAGWAWEARLKLGYAWLQIGKEDGGIDLLKAVQEADEAAPKVRDEAARLLRWWGVDLD